MTEDAKKQSGDVEVVPATLEQQPILANLLQLYAHDFSEFHNVDLGSDGRFGYAHLPLYWSQPERYPFLIKVDGRLVGFALVKSGSEISGDKTTWDMAEFFVIRGCRRRGVGTRIAHELWARFSGTWEVRVMQSNVPAYLFWMRAISVFAEKAVHPILVKKAGESWNVFSFESRSK